MIAPEEYLKKSLSAAGFVFMMLVLCTVGVVLYPFYLLSKALDRWDNATKKTA